MNYLQLARTLYQFKQHGKLSRRELLNYQNHLFRKLLKHTWARSSFYRSHYSAHGIQEKQLDTIPVTELPFTNKDLLMAHFDGAVTDNTLEKSHIESWLETEYQPGALFQNEYVIVHTSGSSGSPGIFPYHKTNWTTFNAALMLRLLGEDLKLLKRTKMVFYAATHGRFAGATVTAKAPKLWFNMTQLSVLDALSKNVAKLNQIQPEVLTGYSSTIAELAEQAAQGQLKIKPTRIIVSGDRLTKPHRELIKTAWRSKIIELYAATECPCVAIRHDGHEAMTMYDDMLKLEIINTDGQPAKNNEMGKMVFTNLHNTTLPMIRYEMSDLGCSVQLAHTAPFSAIGALQGREQEALPILCDDGSQSSLHPSILGEFFVAGLEKIQFISTSPKEVTIQFVGDTTDAEIKEKFATLLSDKQAKQAVTVKTEKVSNIANNPKTGKFQMIRVA